VITIEHVTPIFNETGALCKYHYSRHTDGLCTDPPSVLALGELRNYLLTKAFVFYDASAGGHIVVLIHNPYGQLSFARLGDDKWTWLPQHSYFHDCIYKDGLLYAVTSHGEIYAFNLRGPVVALKVITGMDLDMEWNDIYIVQAPSGDLLQVRRSREWFEDSDQNPETVLTNTSGVKIYKVGTAATELLEINCLHDHVLFLGHNQSLCLSAKEHPHLKANHVYFTDDQDYLYGIKNNIRDIGVFDLAKNNKVELVSPHLWSNWPTPMWITPSIRKIEMTSNE
jgi:outer membrane protein assembly factor BamB